MILITISWYLTTLDFLNFSSGDEPPCDSQSSVSRTETHTSSSHPQSLPRVPWPAHLHQNARESQTNTHYVLILTAPKGQGNTSLLLLHSESKVIHSVQWIKSWKSRVFPLCTQTFREPVSDYQVVREKAASQRRDVERALTRFMAKTGETQSLFKDDITAFPCKHLHQPSTSTICCNMCSIHQYIYTDLLFFGLARLRACYAMYN